MDSPDKIQHKPIDLRVSSTTNVHFLATAMVKYFQEGYRVQISCIGVVPISIAMKAIAVAEGKVSPEGFTLAAVPLFYSDDVTNRDNGLLEKKTVMRFCLYRFRTFDLSGLSV